MLQTRVEQVDDPSQLIELLGKASDYCTLLADHT